MGGCISPIHLNYQSWEEDAKECVCQGLSRPTKNKRRSLHHIKTKLVWSKVWEKDRVKLSYGLYGIKQL
jgi:hypothetical protein